MSISGDMKKIGEDIISSYKLRIKSVGEIVSETHNMLTDFQKEHKITVNELKVMADEVKKFLGKGETDRLKEFDKMMADIQNKQTDRNKYVADLLQKFTDEQKVTVNELKVMADELKKSLGKGETDRLAEFDKMMADVQNKQADRNKYVADLLKKFTDEQKVTVNELKVMADELKKSLGKG
ncbi:MAG: hypothetical protein HQ534_01750, partial [Armatimonadetes bacterium]|nr:hypothetical protein [Armatimonadota bacterium]